MTARAAKSAGTQGADKPKRKAPRTAWKPGQSGNPAGGVKRGQSWAELIREIGDMDGLTAAARATKRAAETFKGLPEGVTLKELVVLRVFAAMIDEPTPGLWSGLMDRADGKTPDKIEAHVTRGVSAADLTDDELAAIAKRTS